jgi:hypothetical protein
MLWIIKLDHANVREDRSKEEQTHTSSIHPQITTVTLMRMEHSLFPKRKVANTQILLDLKAAKARIAGVGVGELCTQKLTPHCGGLPSDLHDSVS